MCQNINKFISGINGCNSCDVAKCKSFLSTVIETLNSASALLSSIYNDKRKELFLENHSLESFAADQLAYLEEAQRQIITVHQELQSASNKLTTAHINLLKKHHLCQSSSQPADIWISIVQKKTYFIQVLWFVNNVY